MGKILGKAAFDAQDVEKLVPHGDRLLVEKIEIEDVILVDGAFKPNGEQRKIVISRENPRVNPRDPSPQMDATLAAEISRGWILVRIVAVGNGHRLEMDMTVPMPFKKGDYVYIERLAQHGLEFRGQRYYIVSQIDVLLLAPDITHLAAVPELNRVEPALTTA